MARVFADLITNQPTNPSSLSYRPQRAAVPLVRPFSPLEALFIKSPEHKEETEWTVCASHELSTLELLEFLSPFGGLQTFALGIIEQIVLICRL